MNIAIIALTNTLIGTVLTVRWKHLRTKGLHPVSALGLFCFAIPLWLASLLVLSSNTDIVYSRRYLLYVVLWASLVVLTNLGSVFLMKFQTLSEGAVYKLGISTALGILVDSLIFKTDFSISMLTGIAFLLLAGILLSQNKRSQEMDARLILLGVVALSILGIFQCTLYKCALAFQPNPMVHGVISQLVIYLAFVLFAGRYLRRDYRARLYGSRDAFLFGLLIFLYTITEAYLFKALPLTILILLSVLNLVIFAVYDVRRKEITPSRRLYLAGALSLLALVLINVAK
jgi:hypothetical protein